MGEAPQTRKDEEALFHCKFCGHHKRKLECNLLSYNWHCWTCNSRGKSFRSLFRKLNVPKSYYQRLFEITKEKSFSGFTRGKETSHELLKLPEEFIPLSKFNNSLSPHRKHALKYLKNRNISEIDILRYNIGYAENGEYSGRVIIPSYDEKGNLNFFSSRAFYPSMKIKYRNPPWSKDIVGFGMLINWNLEDVTLVEGVFDAIAIRRNAIPLFGKTLSYSLKESLIINGIERVNIVLDNDARNDAVEIQKFLNAHEIDSRLVKLDGKDPSEIGFEKMINLINESQPTTFHNMLEMKLFE